MSVSLAITAKTPSEIPAAMQLSTRLGLPFVLASATQSYAYCLEQTAEQLQLIAPREPHFTPIVVDFLSPQIQYRLRQGGGRRELIARAVGLKGSQTLSVIDLTAGLGQDGFVLARLGCQVTLVERSAIVAALLEDGLKRLQTRRVLKALPESSLSLQLTCKDSVEFLQALTPADYPDVFYLDPMYPERKKTAQVKKELRVLRAVVGDDLDASALLPLALARAKRRVVVKRPRLAPTLTAQKPGLVFSGASCRFDVYILNKR